MPDPRKKVVFHDVDDYGRALGAFNNFCNDFLNERKYGSRNGVAFRFDFDYNSGKYTQFFYVWHTKTQISVRQEPKAIQLKG